MYPNYISISRNIFKNNPSTRSRAQGVFRRKVRLDLIEGLCVKQRMGIRSPSSFQPKCVTNCSKMVSSLRP